MQGVRGDQLEWNAADDVAALTILGIFACFFIFVCSVRTWGFGIIVQVVCCWGVFLGLLAYLAWIAVSPIWNVMHQSHVRWHR